LKKLDEISLGDLQALVGAGVPEASSPSRQMLCTEALFETRRTVSNGNSSLLFDAGDRSDHQTSDPKPSMLKITRHLAFAHSCEALVEDSGPWSKKTCGGEACQTAPRLIGPHF
jgi:hypothetical protein